MPDALDILYLIAPSVIAALPLWLTVRLFFKVDKATVNNLSLRQQAIRTGFVLLFFTVYGSCAAFLLNTMWPHEQPAAEAMVEWSGRTLPGVWMVAVAVWGLGMRRKQRAIQ